MSVSLAVRPLPGGRSLSQNQVLTSKNPGRRRALQRNFGSQSVSLIMIRRAFRFFIWQFVAHDERHLSH